jgi:hypothetical protein
VRRDELIDPPRRDATPIGLLDHRHERLLGPLPGRQERREVAALPELRDLRLDLTRPRVPPPQPIPVPMRGPIRRPLTKPSADQPRDLDLHQLPDHPAQRLAQKVGVLVAHQLGDDLVGRHPLDLGHRGAPLVELRRSGDLERRGGRNHSFRPPRSYTTLRNMTQRTPAATCGRPALRVGVHGKLTDRATAAGEAAVRYLLRKASFPLRVDGMVGMRHKAAVVAALGGLWGIEA